MKKHGSARDRKGLAPRLARPKRSGALDSPVARLAPCRQKQSLFVTDVNAGVQGGVRLWGKSNSSATLSAGRRLLV